MFFVSFYSHNRSSPKQTNKQTINHHSYFLYDIHFEKCTAAEFHQVTSKGTVSVISSDLPLDEWHVRFTMISLLMFNQGFRRYSHLYSGKLSAKKACECKLARSVRNCTVYTVHCNLESPCTQSLALQIRVST